MEYTDDRANEIIRAFRLDPSTARTWRRRGTIPDHYADPRFRLAHGDDGPCTALALRLTHPALRLRGFSACSPDRLTYVLRKGGVFTPAEAFALLTEMDALRSLALACLALPSPSTLQTLLDDPRLKPSKCFGPDYRTTTAAAAAGDAAALQQVTTALQDLATALSLDE
ncbi:MAG: hypothetical protein ACKOA4_00310 [Haliscomenobacter sp.]